MKETETKTQNKAAKVAKTVLNVIINILITVVLIVSLLVAVFALTSKANGISTIFGYTIQTIQTDSMKGGSDEYEGGDFAKGDVIIGKATNSDPNAVYEVGDIVTYYGELSGTDQQALITHRIIEIGQYGADGSKTVYRTKGDNSFDADQDSDDTFYYIPASDIKSVFYNKDYHGTIIKGLGNVLDYIKSQQGFFLVVLLPMIIFFMYELVRVVLNASSYRKAKADEDQQEAVEAAVAEALAAKEAESSPASTEMSPEQMEQFKQFLEFQKQQKAQQTPGENESE